MPKIESLAVLDLKKATRSFEVVGDFSSNDDEKRKFSVGKSCF